MSKPSARFRWIWRPRWRHAILALASMAGLVMGRVDLATAQPRTLAPIYWQQRLFFIPYQINRHDKSLRAVAMVQLLISRDGKSDWRVLEQAEPNVQGFSYHAPEDGEYWFALRHLDQHGEPWPSSAVQPQLRIMVDTHLPELELSGALNATGAVVVRYEARDASLRPETLVIEVRPVGGTWSSLNPGPPDVSHADRLVGRVEWNAPFGASRVEVRGSIADGAGHRAQASTEVTLSGPALRMPAAAIALAPARGNEADDRGGPSPHTLSVDSFRSTTSTPAQDWPATNRLPRKSAASSDAVNLFAGSRPPAPPPIRNPYSTSAPAGSSRRTPARLIGERTNDLAPTRQPEQASGGSRVSPDDWSPPARTPAAITPVEGGARVVNSRTFDVQYDLESIGPWGVAKVELWGTHDGGRTWQSFGVDNDNRSPVRVTVLTAGVYGFRILVDGANGAAASPPRSGDKPELVVAVDLQPPTAELLSADIGEGNLTGHLVIRWAVADTNLEPRPISLFYGTLPNGPWSTIAAGLENTGGYTWRLERHVPDRFYLRLEARDVAGNLATCQTPTPIMLNRPQPTGRLRGVRPVAADLRPRDECFAPIGLNVLRVVPKRAAGRVLGLAIVNEPGNQAGRVPGDFVA
ncbi:MAG: hypothetical protein IH831_11555, partial [Planctomycetes bacterium]|nr:hypothetical protein [Planctomycetota bacterium]